MMEVGVVIDQNLAPIFWHLPEGRTGGSLPDSRLLWDVLWDNRKTLMGFAHSHPGGGRPGPSNTDITTFVAIEAALGRRLDWWITSSDTLVVCRQMERDGRYGSIVIAKADEPPWADDLRRLSTTEENGNGSNRSAS
jgi:hypothetical protein